LRRLLRSHFCSLIRSPAVSGSTTACKAGIIPGSFFRLAAAARSPDAIRRVVDQRSVQSGATEPDGLLTLLVHAARHGDALPIILLSVLISVAIVLLQNDELFRAFLRAKGHRPDRKPKHPLLDITALRAIRGVDVVCFDKTGVLTRRDLAVKSIYFFNETSFDSLVPESEIAGFITLACALCNDVTFAEWMVSANPIDRALIAFGSAHGIDFGETVAKYERIYDKPFDSEDRYMACGFHFNGQELYFAKGDPEVIVRMCGSYVTGSGETRTIDLNFLAAVRKQMDSMDRGGDVAIALALRSDTLQPRLSRYAFLCIDPAREPATGRGLQRSGQTQRAPDKVSHVDGDRVETAMKIGTELGMEREANARLYLTGKDIAKMPLSEVSSQSAFVSIFARLLPSQKGVLVRLF
jgi:Ca2+-transporting ATPase